MGRTNKDLAIVPPEPVQDETTPLLRDQSEIAEQELREHDLNSVPIADEPSVSRLLLTMSSLWACTFLAALDATIVATLAPSITATFNAPSAFPWIAGAYLITNAAFQPLSGKLTDIYGRRAGLIFATTFFAAGTFLCGIAQEAWVIILGRLIAGAGGGCLNTISTFVASDLIPLRKRGVWQGIGNIVFGTGMGLGGIFGGFVDDKLGWRWAFYLQCGPIVIAGILAIVFVKVPIKQTETNRIKRVDFLGSITLVTALVLLLLALNSGGTIVPWNHPLVYVSLPLSAVALALFVYVEDRVATEPIIPVRLLFIRSVAAACLTNWFATMAVFGVTYHLPIYLQAVTGANSTQTGLRLIPQSVGAAIGSLGSGLLMRATGKYIILNVFMQALFIAGAAAILGTFNTSVNQALPFVFLLMIGTAYGSMLTVTLISLIAAVDHKYQAVITSASYAFRSTGSVIGIAVCSAILQNFLQEELWSRFGAQPNAAEMIAMIRDKPQGIKDLPEPWREGAIAAYTGALRLVWGAVLGFTILAAITSLLIKQQKLFSNLSRS